MSLMVIILAAGKGTRMKSDTSKLLFDVAGKKMLSYVIDCAKTLNPSSIVTVVGKNAEDVKKYFADDGVTFVLQKEQNGTADAVKAAWDLIHKHDGKALILSGDMPNIKSDTIKKFIETAENHSISFISVNSLKPDGYGRVVRTPLGDVMHIVEEKDANIHEKKIKEINCGIYLCDAKALAAGLENISSNNAQNEYYLTDIVKKGAYAWIAPDEKEFLGINDRKQLSESTRLMYARRADSFMLAGVSLIDPQTVYIDPQVVIENDVVIYPNVFLQGKTVIKKGCVIYSGVRIVDSIIENNCTIKDNSLIEESKVGRDSSVGPMAHLRPGCELAGNNRIGNFVELKKAIIAEGSKANHLTYLGDCEIGKDVNIGCGTITCNYDGFHKHKTVIQDGVFVGSDVQLVAPVEVGKNAIIAAGTTVTKDVPADALAISRTEQKNMANKATLLRELKNKK